MAENHHRALNRPIAAILLAGLVVGFYWKLVLTNQFTWLESPGLFEAYIPHLQLMAAEWHQGRIPLWDPSVANPLNWVLFSLPLRNGWVKQFYLHWYFVVIHILAAWAAYRLARDLRCGRGAAIFSGCVYSLTGWMGSLNSPDVLTGGICAPLVVMHALRILRGGDPLRAGLWGGFFLGLSWLGGHHDAPIYLSLGCAGLWLAALRKRRAFAGAIIFYTVSLGTAAVHILPAALTLARKVPVDFQEALQFRPADLLGILLPGWWSRADPFLGSCAVLFAALGVALAWRQASTKALVFLGLGGLFYSMAGFSVFHGVVSALLPLADNAPNSSNAMLLFHVSAAALAGIGLESWLRVGAEDWARRLCRASLVFAGLVFAVFAGLALTRGFQTLGDDRPLAVALAAIMTAGLLWWKVNGELSVRSAVLLVLAIFLFEAGLDTTFNWRNMLDKIRVDYYAKYRETGDLANFLLRQPGYPRVYFDRSLIGFNFGDLYGINQVPDSMDNMPGVSFAVLKEPTPVFRELAFTSQAGYRVFRNPDAYPRAWTDHQVASPRVDIPAGGHEVVLRFRPATVYQGAAISLTTLFIAALAAWRWRRQ